MLVVMVMVVVVAVVVIQIFVFNTPLFWIDLGYCRTSRGQKVNVWEFFGTSLQPEYRYLSYHPANSMRAPKVH